MVSAINLKHVKDSLLNFKQCAPKDVILSASIICKESMYV